MVDTKDQSNAIVYWVWYFVCRHCRYKDQSMQGIECYICWHCRYKTHPHIPAHNFLNIQWIFNQQKVLESWDSGLFNHTIYTIYVDTVDTETRISNAFNAIYVDTVDTKHIHTFLLITFLIFNGFSISKKFWKAETQGFSTIPSILYMSTLSIQRQGSLMHSMLSMSTLSIQNTSTHSCL